VKLYPVRVWIFETVVWYVCQGVDLIPWLFGIMTAIVVEPDTEG
jgi:hypothetical protein